MPATRLLRHLALALACLLPFQAPAAAEDDPAARQVWQLLEYIAVDYAGAVEDGRIIDEDEYQEMVEFSGAAHEGIGTLGDNAAKAGLLEGSSRLAALIGRRAPVTEVAAAARALADGLLDAYGIPAAPSGPPKVAAAVGVYADLCASCHGRSGAGDGEAAAGMQPPPIAFTDRTRAAQRTPLALYEVITQGLADTPMPGFPQLPETDRWALAFLVGGMAFSDDERARGERLWQRSPALHAALPSLEALSRSSESQLSARLPNGEAGPVLAYLRAQPEAVRAASAGDAPLHLARRQLQAAVDAYAAGDAGAAHTRLLAAYLDGVEPIEPVLAVRDGALLRELETAMARVRSSVRAGEPLPAVQAEAANAGVLLDRAEALLGDSATGAAAFLGSFTILLREGIEALLIVVGMLTFLRRAHRPDLLPWVHAGWLGALFAGGLTWAAATWLIDISGAQREVTEGLSALFAALVLLGVGIWMHRKSMAGQWQQYLNRKLSTALGRRSAWLLFALSFVAVYREVFETILFYAAMWNQGNTTPILGGLLAGALALVVVAAGLLRLGMRLPIGRFFAWSSVLIAVLAVVLTGKGVVALQEAGWVGLGPVSVPRIDWLGIYPSWESLLAQLLVAVVAAAGFAVNARGGRQTARA